MQAAGRAEAGMQEREALARLGAGFADSNEPQAVEVRYQTLVEQTARAEGPIPEVRKVFAM
jgi:hypothetical protein